MFRSRAGALRSLLSVRSSQILERPVSTRLISTTVPKFAGFRNQYQPQRRRRWPTILLYTIGGLGLTGFALWWVYWPHHTFTSSVAKILRKGLWAESEKGNKDYATALKYYHEALKQADEEGLGHVTDEYTGIQLKICEMYERLNMNSDALMLYSEIAACYLDALTADKIPDNLRPHIIQKDLRVVIKIVELNKTNAQNSKALLLTHFLIAQAEVGKRSSVAASLINEEIEEMFGENRSNAPENKYSNNIIDGSIKVDKDNNVQILNKNKEAWEPFRNELFNARDLYVAICVATGDLSSGIRAKIATTSWMLNADCNPGEILMSQTNLGSLLYLQAEAYEANEFKAIKAELPESEILENRQSKEKCLKLATQCYDAVLQFSKKLPAQLRQEGNVDESIALATYGLGVINLHVGKLDSAKSLLRESRLRAKGSGFVDLVFEAERELNRLQTEFDRIEAENKIPTSIDNENDRIKALLGEVQNQPDIEMDVQMVKVK